MSSQLCIIIFLYLKILFVTCRGNSSLTFAIDDTNSMRNEIDEVIRGSRGLLDFILKTKSSEIQDLILVTFNDPGVEVRAKTNSKTEFIRALESIHLHDGDDCPEYSMTGIIKALKISRPDSYLYVFTDAFAKDYSKIKKVINLCEQKQSQVIFVLTGVCDPKENPIQGYNVYHKIAKACSGSVIQISSNEVHLVVDMTKHLVDDRKTILSWIEVPHSSRFTPVSFTLDEKTEYAIITASGPNVEFVIRKSKSINGPILPIESITWTKHFKVVKLVNNYPGTYTAWVKGYGGVSIVVYGKTDFTFEYGFSDFVPKSLADTSKQPIADKEHYLSISVRDPQHEVNIKWAEILSTDKKVLMKFPLRKIGQDFYVTDHFIPPKTTFKVAVKGSIIPTGKPIVRVSKISVKPRIPVAKIPSVTIKEGPKIEINYGSSVSLTCEVLAYPRPKIQWYDSDNNLLESQSSMIEFPYEYASYLKVNQIKRSKSYICQGSNDLKATRTSIQINVISPLKNIAPFPAVTKAKYGKELKLNCLIHSAYPTQTQWGFNGSIHKLSLSADRSELTIKDMDINVEGKYGCKVFLIHDPEIKEVQTTQVIIDDLARPEIEFDSGHITVRERSKIKISCRILKGTPRPKISWQYRKNDGSEFISLSESSEELTIHDISLNHSGNYVCTATNDLGRVTAVAELEVLKSPEIFKDGNSHVHVLYDSKHMLTCRIIAHPPPTIIWKDKLGNIFHSTKVSSNKFEFTSRLNLEHITKPGTYSCFAENSVGKSEQQFEVSVESPLKSHSKLNVVKEVKYGEKVTLKCDVTSDFTVERNWIVNKSKEFIKSDDKYTLTRDANDLIIKSMDIDLQGTYICSVKLKADPNIFVEKNIALVISDLARPEIRLDSGHVAVREKSTKTISCRILKGNPRPKISWQYRKNDGSEFISLSESSEELTIHDISLNHSGNYVCTATNDLGRATAVAELEVLKSPEIFKDGNSHVHVLYDSKHMLTCRIIAHPPPTIIWKDKLGNIVHSTKVSSNKFEFTSRLNLEHITKPGTYSCFAENSVGKSEQQFEVSVESPLKSHSKLNVVKEVKYGEKVTLKCDVTSDFTVERNWIVNKSKDFIKSDDKYTLTRDANDLIIKSMDIDLQGTYICSVKLKADPNIFVEKNIALVISDLARPEIRLDSGHVAVREKSTKTISCRILKGNPRPKISWQYRKNDGSEFISLSESSEELTIHDISLNHSGNYVCTATNDLGRATAVAELEVLKSPKIFKDGNSHVHVLYDSKHMLTCRIIAHPPPTIIWKDKLGNIVHSTKVSSNKFEFTSRLNLEHITKPGTYSCFAENSVGKSKQQFEVSVEPPLKSHSKLNVVKEVKYGEKVTLKCDVTSDFTVERNWIVNKSKDFIKSDDKYTLTRDANDLIIKSMDIDLQGTYICSVKLKADPNIFVEKNIALVISDLARPEIRLDSGHVAVREKSTKTISCRILKGNPRPKISWQYRKNDGSEFISLSESSEELTIHDISLNHSGNYVCTATNDLGRATAVAELEVLKSPEIFKDGNSHVHVLYDSKHMLTCRIIAHPPPTIIWKDKLGNIVHSTKVSSNKFEFTSRLNLEHITKPGTYSCFAENSVGKSEQQFEVSVESPLKSHSKLNVVKEVKYGEKVTLKCDVTSDFTVERNWIVNKSKDFIKSDDKYTLTRDANDLIIKSMDIDLQGTYICSVKLKADPNIFVEKNIALVINDLAPPKLASSKEILNKTFTARCVITMGVPQPVVIWKFKGDSGGFTDLGVEGEILTINNIQRQHNGSYQCIAKNAIGTDNAILSLEIEESPKIVTEKTEYRGVVGDKVLVILCNATGYPDPSIVWKNSDNEIIEAGSKYIIKGSLNVQNLYIFNPIEKDTGKLICEAQNKVGTTSITFDIFVATDMTDDGDLGEKHYVHLLDNESKDINCTLFDSDSHSLRWYKNGYLTKVTGIPYPILKATVSDDGNYTCRVNTDIGSVSETFVVDVGHKPVFKFEDTLVNWLGNENEVVDCNVRAKPAAQVEWFVDGERTNTKDFIHQIHDWGKYKCKVSNIHGIAEKTVTVTTSGCLINRTMEENNNPPFILSSNINVDDDEPVLNNNKYMFIDHGDQMKLTCHKADKNTFNLFPDTETIIAECDREDKFHIDGKTYKFSDFKCKEPLTPLLKPTEKKCINVDSKVIEVGFEVPNFVKIYQICYDSKLNLTNYGYSKLSQHNLGNQEKKWTGKFPYDIDYCDEESKCCYRKGQLVNAVDVDIGPPQISSFIDLNAISVWEPCEKENRTTWRKLEERVRSLLLSYDTFSTFIEVWSGASGYENKDVRMIPRYLWKVLKVNEDTIAVVVYVNTPNPKTKDIKCKKPEHILEELGIGDDAFTYFCSLEEFSKAFGVPMDTFN